MIPFDPLDHYVVTRTEATSLRTEDYAARHFAYLSTEESLGSAEDSPDFAMLEKAAVGRMTWETLLVGAIVNAGKAPIVVADDVSADLGVVAEALLDQDGSPKTELNVTRGGGDILYIDRIWVDERFDFVSVGRELLEHVLEAHAGGCFGASYLRDRIPGLGIERLFLDRGFHLVSAAHPLFFRDLGLVAPKLPAG